MGLVTQLWLSTCFMLHCMITHLTLVNIRMETAIFMGEPMVTGIAILVMTVTILVAIRFCARNFCYSELSRPYDMA